MEWLTQNWIWIIVVIGGYFLMSRMGMGGCCGMGHSHGHGHSGGKASADTGVASSRGADSANGADSISAVPQAGGRETEPSGASTRQSHQQHGCC